MTARVTIERVLRDDDDPSGQSVRMWKIEAEAGQVVIRLQHGDGFVLMRPADVERFCGDLLEARDSAESLKKDIPAINT